MKFSSETVIPMLHVDKVSSTTMRKSAFSLSLPVTCAILLVFITIIPTGSAIKCYVCQSKYNPECAGDLPANPTPDHRAYKFLIDCSTLSDASGPQTLCRKQDQEVEGSKNVIRSCGAIKGDKDCYQASNPPTRSIVCQCFEDGCNSATGLSSSILLISLLFSSLLLFGFAK